MDELLAAMDAALASGQLSVDDVMERLLKHGVISYTSLLQDISRSLRDARRAANGTKNRELAALQKMVDNAIRDSR